jgi:hypothetical protein
MNHSYQIKDLPAFLAKRWSECGCMGKVTSLERGPIDQLPEHPILEHLLSVCYYASLLREEDRPVRFRIILREPEQFPPENGPPSGSHRLVFTKPLLFNEEELRRLFPSADFHRSLIGVRLDADATLQIWGLVHPGSRWINDFYGGRHAFSPLPASLVVSVTDPGRIVISRGAVTMATLNGREIICPSGEIFDTEWFPKCFAATRAELWALHLADSQRAGKVWTRLDPDIVRRIAQQVDRRVISTIRNSRHGGTLVFLPVERADAFAGDNPYMTMRYQFIAEEPRNRFRTLIVALLNALAQEFGPNQPPDHLVGWDEYVTSKSETLSLLEEGIMEVAHLIAGLAAMDGAVVLTNKYELLGCGAEIACESVKIATVLRAVDADATQTVPIRTDHFGARHRSAYRLCSAFHDVIAIVISQDRTVRLVKWHDGAVTYWDQVATSVLDF